MQHSVSEQCDLSRMLAEWQWSLSDSLWNVRRRCIWRSKRKYLFLTLSFPNYKECKKINVHLKKYLNILLLNKH